MRQPTVVLNGTVPILSQWVARTTLLNTYFQERVVQSALELG